MALGFRTTARPGAASSVVPVAAASGGGSYTVDTVPDAGENAGRTIWVTDGADGDPCGAISSGTEWLRIVTGDPIVGAGSGFIVSGSPDSSYDGLYSPTSDVWGGTKNDLPTYKNANDRYLASVSSGGYWKLMTSSAFSSTLGATYTQLSGNLDPTLGGWGYPNGDPNSITLTAE